ncbi:MAG: M48 family metalloprotease [Elusimicrobiota bacterium]
MNKNKTLEEIKRTAEENNGIPLGIRIFFKETGTKKSDWKGKSWILTVIFILITSCVRNPATRKVHARLLSQEAERKIGESTKEKILEQYEVFQSTPISQYVNRIGQKISEISDRPTVDYSFTILDSDLVNAFAAPGGFIFITRGLLESIDDEAELAMVLGHEIAHVTALHGVQMIQKEMGQNALYILGTIGAAVVLGPDAILLVANTANLFSSLYLLGYSREKELEADHLGVRYVLRAGYDPMASVRFLKQLQKNETEEEKGWDLYFRTHPTTKERIDIIQNMIGRSPEDLDKSNREEFQKMKNLIPKVSIEEKGVISNNSYSNPSRNLVLYVPENWTLGHYSTQALISFQTKNKEGEGRLQEVDLSSMTVKADLLAEQYAKVNGFQLHSGRQVLYPSGYGYLGRYMGVSASGNLLEMRLFSTIRKHKGYILLCGVPPEKADRYSLDFEKILRSFQFNH